MTASIYATMGGDHGIMSAASWFHEDGRWWYCHTDGSYTRSGWEQIDGKRYLFDAGGWMQTGWQNVGGTWYAFGDSGVMQYGVGSDASGALKV